MTYVCMFWANGKGPWQPFVRRQYPELLTPFDSLQEAVEAVQRRLKQTPHYATAVFEEEDMRGPLLIVQQSGYPLDGRTHPEVARIGPGDIFTDTVLRADVVVV